MTALIVWLLGIAALALLWATLVGLDHFAYITGVR